ncbi:MAG: hypothetical protein CME06_01125 [Gemmatimonadetes bacterium]|nr:hypothetical protein [Gemmatimonadota bacterium]
MLFGAMSGDWYGDNPRYVFEWVLANRPGIEPLWITKSSVVARRLRSEGKPVALAFSLAGLVALARAEKAVFSDGLMDLAMDPVLVPNSLSLIALRHGRSVKRVRFARLGHKISEGETRAKRKEGSLTRVVISTSEFVSDIQEECLQIGREKHVVTGYPRNDVLMSVPRAHVCQWNLFLGEMTPAKTVLYAPTWRHGRNPTRFFPFDDVDISALHEFCERRQCLILLRPHRGDLVYPEVRAFFDELTGSPWIRLATHVEFHDVNSFLPFVDGLVCDYSALYHDFLLLDRPLIFVPYDYEEFAMTNGFLYDYFEWLPGSAVSTFADFLLELTRIGNGSDAHSEARRLLRDRIHTYQDASSTERVAELL